jgi:PAS domain S-box-containing protein
MKDDNKTKKQLIHELAELHLQNAALKKSTTGSISYELAAEESRRYAESIVETVREPLLVLDADLKIISANRNFYKTFKVTPDETIGSFIYDLGNKQWNIPKLRELLEEVLPEKEAFDDFEVAHNFQDIGYKIMLLNARQIYRKDIGAKMILLAIEDITERKQLERLLIDTEEQYRRLFETASDGIVLLEKREGKITQANPATEKLLGYTEKESIGNKLQDIGVVLDMSDFQTTMQTLNKSGIINYRNVKVETKSGQHIDTEIYLVDRAKLVQCNIRDITARMRAERSLAENEARLRTLVQTIPNLIWLKDADGVYLSCNTMFERFFGAKEADIVGKTDYDFVDRELADFFREHDRKAMAAGKPSANEEWLTFADDGHRGLFDTIKTPMYDAEGKLIGVLGISHDITERKQAEEEHKAHIRFLENLERINQAIKEETDVEQMLRHILQTVFSIFDCDRAWLFYPCDPDAPTFRVPVIITKPEYPAAEVLDADLPIPPDMAQNLREALETDDPVTYIAGTEKPINKVTAEQFGVQSQMFVALYPKLGKPWVFGMHQCSYPRIWTEEEKKLFKEIGRRISDGLSSVLYLRELHENEARLSDAQRLAQIGNWEWNLLTNQVWWSDETYRIFGVTPQDFVPSLEANGKFIHPDDFARYGKSFEHSLQTGEPLDIDIRLVTNDGLLKHCHAKGKPIYDDSAQPTRFIGTIMDITERKRATAAVAENERKFSTLISNLPGMAYRCDNDREWTMSFLSKGCRDLTDYAPEEILGNRRLSYNDVINFEHRERIWNEVQTALSKREHYSFEYSITTAIGDVKWVWERGCGIFSPDGEVQALEGFISDVSERKKADEALRNSEGPPAYTGADYP